MSSFKGRRLGFVDASENYHILYNNARRRINVWVPGGSIDPMTFICQVHTCCYVSHTRQRKLPDSMCVCVCVCVCVEMTCYSMPSADRKKILLTVTITCPSHNITDKTLNLTLYFYIFCHSPGLFRSILIIFKESLNISIQA
jgi:hypothetical protein